MIRPRNTPLSNGVIPIRLPHGGKGSGGSGPLTITGVSLTNSSFTGGSSSGTFVGTISVQATGGSFSGSLSLTGADAASFQIVGTSLETNGVVGNGTYSINIVATQAGATGSPFSQPKTITGSGGPLTITGVLLSNNSFTGGSPSGTVVGNISVTATGGSFAGSLSLTGTNAASFQIVGNALQTNGTVAIGTYSINIVATQGGATGSPFSQPETITGNSTSNVITAAAYATTAESGQYMCIGIGWTGSAPSSATATWSGSGGSATIASGSFSVTGPFASFWCATPTSAGTYDLAVNTNNGGAVTISSIVIATAVPDFAPGIYGPSTPMLGWDAPSHNTFFDNLPIATYFYRGPGIPTATLSDTVGGSGDSFYFKLNPTGSAPPGRLNMAFALCIGGGASWPNQATFAVTITISNGFSTPLTKAITVQNPTTGSFVAVNCWCNIFHGGGLFYGGNLVLDTAVTDYNPPNVSVVQLLPRGGASSLAFTTDSPHGFFSYNSSEGTIQINQSNLIAANFGHYTVQVQANSGGPLQTVDLWIGHDAPPVVAFVPTTPWNLYSSTPATNGYGSNQIGTFSAWADSHGGVHTIGAMARRINSDSTGHLVCYNSSGEMYLNGSVLAGTLLASLTVTSTGAKSTTMALALPIKVGTTLSASNMSGSITPSLTNFLTTANALTPSGSPLAVIGLTVSGFSNPINWTAIGTSVASPIIDIIQDVANGIMDNAQMVNGGSPLYVVHDENKIVPRYDISGSGTTGTVTASNLSAKDPSTSYTDNVRITLSDGLGTYCTQTFGLTTAWNTAPSGEVQVGPSSALWPSPTFATVNAFSNAFWTNPSNYAGATVRLLRGAGARIATFTGTISGSTLTVSGVTGTIIPDLLVSGSGVDAHTTIVSGSGTTWTVTGTQSVGPVAMRATDWSYLPFGHPYAVGWYPGPVHFFGDDSTQATFTGTISGTTLTVSGVSGTIVVGDVIKTGAAAGTLVTGGSGSSWTVLPSQSVGPVSMTTRMLRVSINWGNSAPASQGFVFSGGYDMSLKDIEISGVTTNAADPPNSDAEAAIYKVANQPGNFAMSGIYLHDNIAGFLNGAPGNHLWFDKCLIVHNGNYSGQLHGIYAHQIAELSVTNCRIGDTKAGHDVKTRAMKTTITNTIIATGINGLPNTNIDLCEGGFFRMSGCTIVSKMNDLDGEHNSVIVALQSEIESLDVPWCWDINDTLVSGCTICSAIPQINPFQIGIGFQNWGYFIAGSPAGNGDPQRGKPFNNVISSPVFWNLPSGQYTQAIDGGIAPTVTGASNTTTFPWTAVQVYDPLLAANVPPFTLPLSGANNFNTFGGSIASPVGTYRMMMVVPSGSGNATNVTDGLLAAIDAHGNAMSSVTYGTWSSGTNNNSSFSFTTTSNKVQLSTVGSLADGIYLVEPQGTGTGYNSGGGTTFTVNSALLVLVGNYT